MYNRIEYTNQCYSFLIKDDKIYKTHSNSYQAYSLGKNQFQEDKMNTEHKLFGFYLGLSVKQKILHLMKNYHYREYYVESYRQYIEGMIEDIIAYESNRKEDIGVRIMSGNGISDITLREAEKSIKISNIFITGHVGETK